MKDSEKLTRYEALIRTANISVFEYDPDRDVICFLDTHLEPTQEYQDYVEYIEQSPRLNVTQRSRYVQFLREMADGALELECITPDGKIVQRYLNKIRLDDAESGKSSLLIWVKDITAQWEREQHYAERSRRDALTRLYNRSAGKKLIRAYLDRKGPYETCGLMVIDVDYFKSVNDVYGHMFGDQVLVRFSALLQELFQEDAVIMRFGGDEFVVFFQNISNKVLIRRAAELVREVRKLQFEEHEYTPTCSVGACYVPENAPEFTYEQLFQNADWALYQAKKNGRNRYAFCDHLRRFEGQEGWSPNLDPDIDARYFQNDIIATAFEIFGKSASIPDAIALMLKITGIRFQLDRISVLQTDLELQAARICYQWSVTPERERILPVESFTREDFQKFYRSYDETDTTVLYRDEMEGYSPQGAALLLQDDASTVLYAAMYNEGRYMGAVAFTSCGEKRFWSRERRREVSELTKLIAAYLVKLHPVNGGKDGLQIPEYDYLTGLLSFGKFRETVERIIVSQAASGESSIMVCSDFENFEEYNLQYGYAAGDQLLKDFADYIIGTMREKNRVYFTRAVADQFILYMPYDWEHTPDAAARVQKLNEIFLEQQRKLRPDVRLRIRTGICPVTPDCTNPSRIIDRANRARKMVASDDAETVVFYREEDIVEDQALQE